MTKKRNLSLFSISVVALLAAACGKDPTNRDSDPLREHPEARTYLDETKAPKVKRAPVEEKEVAPLPLPEPKHVQQARLKIYDLALRGEETTYGLIDVKEGQSFKKTLDARIFQEQEVSFKLVPGKRWASWANIGYDSSLKAWVLSGKPPEGIVKGIDSTSFHSEILDVKIELVGSNSAEITRLFNSEDPLTPFSVRVSRDIPRPVVTAIVTKKNVVKLGSLIPVTVSVWDADSQASTAPEISFTYDGQKYSNGELKFHDAQHGILKETKSIKVDKETRDLVLEYQPKASGKKGVWNYRAKLDTRLIYEILLKSGKIKKSDYRVNVSFAVRAYSLITENASVLASKELQILVPANKPASEDSSTSKKTVKKKKDKKGPAASKKKNQPKKASDSNRPKGTPIENLGNKKGGSQS